MTVIDHRGSAPAQGARLEMPRITIITPCLNGERHVATAADSVLRQNYPDCEHIVLDAASRDGTLDVLRGYPHLQVISEPDRGAHDAMNKGIARASGDVIGFLNADDYYADHTLPSVGRIFAANPDIDVVVGYCGVVEDVRPNKSVVRFIYTHPRGIWLTECLFGNPGINGWFFRRSVFDKVGHFNNDFHISGDRDFLVRTALAGLRCAVLNSPLVWYRAHKSSQNMNGERSNIDAISVELLRMAASFLKASKKSGEHLRLARAWHAFECARRAFVQVRGGRAADAARLIVRCAWRNPLWPLHLVHAIFLRRLVRKNYLGGWNSDLSAYGATLKRGFAAAGR